MKTPNENLPALPVKKSKELLPVKKERHAFDSLEGLAPKQLVQFAVKRNRDINQESVYLTGLYWELGEALRKLKENPHYGKHGRWEKWLERWGIHRTRATKAMEIRRGYKSPDECGLVPVNKAAAAARMKNRRVIKPKPVTGLPPKGTIPTGEVFSPVDGIRLVNCRFQDLGLEPESVAAVLTDLPYDKAWLEHLPEWVDWSHKVLVDGGCCATWYGNLYVPQLLEAMNKRLNYRWILTYAYTSPGVLVHSAGMLCSGCLCPVYHKGQWQRIGCSVKDLVPNAPFKTKSIHPCQKTLEQMLHLVENFTKPGQLVVDPCVGSGTTAEACLRLGRRFIGCDIDPVCVEMWHERFNRLKEEGFDELFASARVTGEAEEEALGEAEEPVTKNAA